MKIFEQFQSALVDNQNNLVGHLKCPRFTDHDTKEKACGGFSFCFSPYIFLRTLFKEKFTYFVDKLSPSTQKLLQV